MASFELPEREGDPPETGKVPPQLQFSDTSPPDIYRKMADWMFTTFDMAREEPTRISVKGARALWLDETIDAPPQVFMPPPGSREFAHIHPDGSFHLVLPSEDETEILKKGWGLYHPNRAQGVNEVLVYAPRNEAELELLKPVIAASYAFATQQNRD